MRAKLLWLIPALLLVSAPVHALRCGTRLVSEGETRLEVRHKCGEPAQIDRWEEERTLSIRSDDYGVIRKRTVTIQVEEWIYNFGPNRFMQRLLFEEGKLIDIESLERGF